MAGDVGIVVHMSRDGQTYEVEFTPLLGKTAAVVTLEASQVRPIGKDEIAHPRQLPSRISAQFGAASVILLSISAAFSRSARTFSYPRCLQKGQDSIAIKHRVSHASIPPALDPWLVPPVILS